MITLRSFCFFVAVAFTCLPAVAQVVPQDVITKLVQLDAQGQGDNVFTASPSPTMKAYFSDGFLQAWTQGMKHSKNYPVFDANPLTGRQGSETNKIVAMKVEPAKDPYANILVTGFDGQSPNYSTRYVFVYENGAWKIDNLVYEAGHIIDLKAHLQKFP